jgi:PKD-like domain/Secretion system C-terminal sorting domain
MKISPKLLVGALMLFASCYLQAQNPSYLCPSNTTPPADLCGSVCIYCNFNGISSSSAGYTSQTPPGWCGSIENEQWLGFKARCNSVTFIVTPSNCTNGDGLQIGVYASCSSAPLSCNGGTGSGVAIPVVITVATIPDSTYYVCIDGWAGDQCDFSITVAPPACIGSSTPISAPTPPIQGDAISCFNSVQTYQIDSVPGADSYYWTAPNGFSINGGSNNVLLSGSSVNSAQITFPSNADSVAVICVTPYGNCEAGNTVCKDIKVIQPTEYIQPTATVCKEDFPFTTAWGDQITTAGTYRKQYSCDSVLVQTVVMPPNYQVTLPNQILTCSQPTVQICGVTYSAPGNYVRPCSNPNACDTTFYFQVLKDSLQNPNPPLLQMSVYADVDGNCMLSAADTLVRNTTIQVNGTLATTVQTGANGMGQLAPTSGGVYYFASNLPTACPPAQLSVPACGPNTQSVTVLVSPISATSYVYAENELEISPNPTTGMVTIRGEKFAEGAETNVLIFNQIGALVFERKGAIWPAQIDVKTLPAGVYQVQVASLRGDVKANGRFVRL